MYSTVTTVLSVVQSLEVSTVVTVQYLFEVTIDTVDNATIKAAPTGADILLAWLAT
jgi:hypothetical protein